MMQKHLRFSRFFFDVLSHHQTCHKGSAEPASGSTTLYTFKTAAGQRLLMNHQYDFHELTATAGWRALEEYCCAHDLDLHLIEGFADEGGRRFSETGVFFPFHETPPLRYVQIIITEHPSWGEELHLLDAE